MTQREAEEATALACDCAIELVYQEAIEEFGPMDDWTETIGIEVVDRSMGAAMSVGFGMMGFVEVSS